MMKPSTFQPNKNYMISAPAGSGKTEALTQRFVSLLENMDPPNPRRILALTYTNKAAAEMRARIIEKIRKEKPDLYKKIRRDLAHLRVQTFHSFGRRLIEHFALELGFDPHLEVLTSPTAKFTEFFYKMLLQAQEGDPELLNLLLQNVRNKASELKGQLTQLLHHRPKWEFLSNPNDPRIRERHSIFPLFWRLLQEFQKEKQRQGILDFPDMELLAHRLLYEEGARHKDETPLWPQILEAFDEATDHLLVDEFQDTNLLQWALISKLTEEWRAGKGAKEEKGVTPTVFIVGDEKQSIYAFRGANVEVFRRARQQLEAFLGEERFEVIEKDENYRSLQAIIDFINRIFPRIFASEKTTEAWKTVYQPFQRKRPIDDPGRVDLVFAELNKEEHNVDVRRKIEAEIFARWILEFIENGWVYENDQTRRRPQYRDFAVMLKTRRRIEIYAQVFRDYGIPFVMEKAKGFFQTEEIQTLVTLTRCLAYGTGAKFSLYRVLNSPLFGELPAEERVQIFVNPSRRSDSSTLTRWMNQHDLRPLSEVLREILMERNYWQTLTTEQAWANVEKFLAWIGELDDEGKTWREIATILAQKQNEGMEMAKLVDPEMNVVQLTTIHSAKGLQWPIVMVGTLSWDRKWQKDILFEEAFDPEKGYRTNLLEDTLIREKMAEEEKRLLYVALTRARDVLVLPIPLGEYKKLKTNISGHILRALDMDFEMSWEEIQSLDPKMPGVFFHRWADLKTQPLHPITAKEAGTVAVTLRHPEPVPIHPELTVTPMAQEGHGGDPEWSLFGTLFHEVVLRVIQGVLTRDPEALQAEVKTQLRRRILSLKQQTEYEQAFWRHWDTLHRIPALQPLLYQQVPRDRIRTEFPLLYKKGSTAYVGRADLVWLREDDIWVVDLKTIPIRGDLAKWVERYRPQMEHYKKALHLLYHQPVRAFLAFSDTGDWAEI